MSNAEAAVTDKTCLMSAVQSVTLRMLNVISHFLLNGDWKEDLVDKWKNALQALETVTEGHISRHLSESIDDESSAMHVSGRRDRPLASNRSEKESSESMHENKTAGESRNGNKYFLPVVCVLCA
jgi:hypothetical protein